MTSSTTTERRGPFEPTQNGQTTGGRHGSVRRRALVLQVLGAILVVTAVIVGLTGSHADAASLDNGTIAIKGSGNTVATSPLVSLQTVNVSAGPNSTLDRSSLETAGFPSGAVVIKVVECADPGGTTANLPAKPTQCEPSTINPGGTVAENGSMQLSGFTVYALPDPTDLGVSNGTVCDATHECVLGIFTNQNDFSKPHLFSAPFFISPASASSATTTSTPVTSGGSSASTSASAAVSVPAGTLANTGGPTLWPWLLGSGAILFIAGTTLRVLRRPASERRR